MKNDELNRLGGLILDASIMAHKELGPGLLESAYTFALRKELILRGVNCRLQVPVEFNYKGDALGKIYVIDILVEEQIIIEVKSVDTMIPIFDAQLITYLKLYQKKLGYLINFNVPLLKDGFHRIVYKF
ncbi:MAG: GxxExxY protein [Chitinophagaceae bacterium]|nr:GxxExxY protein [Chitinophagaceae bacterium]